MANIFFFKKKKNLKDWVLTLGSFKFTKVSQFIKKQIMMSLWLFYWDTHSFLQGCSLPFLMKPLFVKHTKKINLLFLRAIQIGACKLYEKV